MRSQRRPRRLHDRYREREFARHQPDDGKGALRRREGFRAGHPGDDGAGDAGRREQCSARNMDELVALAKAQPGKLNFASAGVGGLPHLAGELFKLTAGIDIVHVPYRGAAPAINDLLGQQVQMAFLDLPVLLPHIRAGMLRPIALGAPKRAPTSPEVPTTAEVGMPDLLIENWYGMIAPGRHAREIVNLLNRVTNEAMSDPQVAQKLADQGLTVAGDTPQHFRDYIGADHQKNGRR